MSKKNKITAVPGAPNPKSVSGLSKNALALAHAGTYETANTATTRAPNEFPIIPFDMDTYDQTAQIKQEVAGRNDMGNWVVPFTSQDAKYLERKRDMVEYSDFDRWIYQKYDLKDPAQSFILQSIAPEQFERRQAIIDYQQNLVSRYAKLRLRGAKNVDDLMFEWMVETNRISLPEGPIWDPKAWMDKQEHLYSSDADADKRWFATYQRGIISLLSIPTKDTSGWQRSTTTSDIRGDKTKPMANSYVSPDAEKEMFYQQLYPSRVPALPGMKRK